MTNNSNWRTNFASGFTRRRDSQWGPIIPILTRLASLILNTLYY